MKNKIIIMIMLCLMLVSTAFSISINTDQDELALDYLNNDKGNSFIYDILAITSETFGERIPLSANNNVTKYYDFKLELNDVDTEYYILFENFYAGDELEIAFHGDLSRDPTLYNYKITLNQQGRYIFKFIPTYDGEANQIYFNIISNSTNNTSVGIINYQEIKPEGFESLMSSFVVGFTKLIEFNIAIWKLTFYVMIFIVTISFILGIFGLAFTIFAYSKKLRNKSKHNDSDEGD